MRAHGRSGPTRDASADADILMIVGSEMGNAEMVGDLVKDELESSGHEVSVVDRGRALEDAGPRGRGQVLLVVTSTTGLGDVPQNIEDLYEELVDGRSPT